MGGEEGRGPLGRSGHSFCKMSPGAPGSEKGQMEEKGKMEEEGETWKGVIRGKKPEEEGKEEEC